MFKKILVWIGLLTIALLIRNRQYTFAVGISIVTVIAVYDYILSHVWKELSWTSSCLMDKRALKEIHGERKLYDGVKFLIMEKKIKKGMTLDQIKHTLKKEIKGGNWEDYFGTPMDVGEYFYRYFQSSLYDDTPKGNGKIILHGYGRNMPTVRLIFTIKNNKCTKIQ